MTAKFNRMLSQTMNTMLCVNLNLQNSIDLSSCIFIFMFAIPFIFARRLHLHLSITLSILLDLLKETTKIYVLLFFSIDTAFVVDLQLGQCVKSSQQISE